MENLSAQIQAAKKAGYSEQEILSHLSKDQTLGPQIQQAINSGYSPAEIIDHVSQPPKLADTAVKYSAGSGLANLADMLPNAVVNVANLGIAGYGALKGLAGSTDLPELIPSDALSGWSKLGKATGLINEEYAPTTAAGKITDFATQAVTGGGINPAAIMRNAVRGLAKPIARDVLAAGVSGIGSGIGNVLGSNIKTGNDSADNALKIGATLLGGVLPGAAIAARGTAGDRASAALNGVTEQQLALARELKRKATSNGSPITDYEAIQAITGLNPKMQTQQRLAEQSDAAADTLTPIMQGRSKANSAMFNKTADSIAPLEQYPDTLAGVLQGAAKKSIDEARNAGNNAAQPFYAASSNNPAVKISPSEWNSIASDPRIAAALHAVKNDPFSGLQNAAEGSVQWLDAAKKWLDSQANVKGLAGDRFAAGNRSGAASDIVNAVDPAIPDYAKARAIVSQNMRENVLPMEQSQVGKLSRSDNFKQQSEALLPDQPADVTPDVVKRTASTIGAEDPDILKRFLAQDLRRKFAESNQANMGGENVSGGSKFAAQVAGNPIQKDNLLAAIESSGAPTAPFSDALDIFRAQGYKPPVNSATVANAEEASKLGGVASALMRPFKAIPGAVDQWRNGMATSDLAKALAAQDQSGPLRIEELARANGVYSPMQQQMLINLLLAGQQSQ